MADIFCEHINVRTSSRCTFPCKTVFEGKRICGVHLRVVRKDTTTRVTRKDAVLLPPCAGTTKKGTQCKCRGANVLEDKSYCGIHKRSREASHMYVSSMEKLQDDCPICFTKLCMDPHLMQTHCGHMFHKHCILRWKESGIYGHTCPICRRNTHITRAAKPPVQRIYTTIETL